MSSYMRMVKDFMPVNLPLANNKAFFSLLPWMRKFIFLILDGGVHN